MSGHRGHIERKNNPATLNDGFQSRVVTITVIVNTDIHRHPPPVRSLQISHCKIERKSPKRRLAVISLISPEDLNLEIRLAAG